MTAPTNADLGVPRTVALRELGVLGVETDGHWSAVRGTRMAMVLAALALAGPAGARAERLTEMVWPSPGQPPTARQSLANIVLRLRSSFGPTIVESTPGGYRIGSHVASDRERFLDDVERAGELLAREPEEALRLVDRALMRWRGEPWLGIERPVEVEADRAHLTQAHARAIRTRAAALMAVGRSEPALSDLRELVDADPFDERSRLQLVRILSESGRRAEALRVVHDAHRVFAERGLLIDRALAEEERRMQRADFASVTDPAPLPEQSTEFVGRDQEVAEIIEALHASRLVTLHGIGGSGKTRLAVRAARVFDRASACGFVALAGVRSRGPVELAFARGLGLASNRLDGLDHAERIDVIVDAAAGSSGVLVVDNCEHVLPDVHAIVSCVLERPGGLRVLATSRVPLGISGERRYPIPPFRQAAELFRRRAAQRGVALDDDQHLDAVGRICELTDQLPLAIEIAAAQTPYRTVQEIADELEHGIVHRDDTQSEPRHESMSAAIRWSHALLDDAAAGAMVKLGVFEAPFQRPDAAAVIGSGPATTVLDTLVRNSLLERSDDAGRSTYRIPVPVQQHFAAELERRGDATEVLLSLADWLLVDTDRPYGDVWWRLSVIDEIDRRLPHARAAIAALRSVGRVDDATRLAARLGGAARHYGHADELIEVLTELWPDCQDQEATADALVALAECADAARRDEIFDPTLGLLAALDGPVGRRHRVYVHCYHALWHMWVARLTDADYAHARDELRSARQVADIVGSPIERAHIEVWQSGVHLLAGEWDAAEAAARRALDDAADTSFHLVATSCLCQARLQLDHPDEALVLATTHPLLDQDSPHGNVLGIVAALACIRRGDVDAGLDELDGIQRRARRGPFAIHQDDAAIAVAYAAHLLHRSDLSLRILDTGVVGYGPWVGYLVPMLCREIGVPLSGHPSRSAAERQMRSELYGSVAGHVIEELSARRLTHGTSPRPG